MIIKTKKPIKCKVLRPAVNIEQRFAKEIEALITSMHLDVKRTLTDTYSDFAMDASIASQARITMNALLDKWKPRFNELSKVAVERMIRRINKNSDVTLNLSLKELANNISIDTSYSNARLSDIIKASTEQAANLITLIPTEYLGEVQGAVMRSITSGQGMADLVPFLEKKYNGNIRHARNVALDQTRKAYASINQAKLEKIGVEEYEWVHTGGSRYPRKDHIEMSGNIYRYDDPPIIDHRTGEKGHPGTAIFCRCVARPIFKWNKE